MKSPSRDLVIFKPSKIFKSKESKVPEISKFSSVNFSRSWAKAFLPCFVCLLHFNNFAYEFILINLIDFSTTIQIIQIDWIESIWFKQYQFVQIVSNWFKMIQLFQINSNISNSKLGDLTKNFCNSNDFKCHLFIDLQLLNFAYKRLLNKPYENEITSHREFLLRYGVGKTCLWKKYILLYECIQMQGKKNFWNRTLAFRVAT